MPTSPFDLGSVKLRHSNDELRHAFAMFDTSDTGLVDLTQVPLLLRAVGVDVTLEEVCAEIEQVSGVAVTNGGRDCIDMSMFRSLVENLSLPPDSEAEASFVFTLLTDGSSSATVTREMLKALLESFAPTLLRSLDGGNHAALFTAMDADGDGEVSRDDWIDFLAAQSLIRV